MSIADNAQAHALLIDGQDAPTSATRTVHDPATGEPLAEVADASAADAERAVAAARAAFRRGDWSRITPGERAAVLDRMADLLEERADEFARTESRNTGKPLKFSSAFDVPLTIDNLRFFAAAARNLEGKASAEYLEGLTSTIRREPIGVCASIAPWNYPLNMAAWKIGPALAAGNTVVLKPSELTPLTALMLGRLALDAGLPPGVLNIVPGPGPEVGGVLARHEDVALISVTGSTAHGRERHARGRRARSSASTWSSAARRRSWSSTTPTSRRPPRARSSAPSPTAARTARRRRGSTSTTASATRSWSASCTRSTGSWSATRWTTPPTSARSSRPSSASACTPSSSARSRPAPRPSAAARRSDGPGAFYPPTVITGAAQDSEIVQNEVFGPVVCVLGFGSDDEAFALANGTRYGLAASAWTKDVFRAQRAARELEAGTVWINEHLAIGSEMPHGGVKGSGFGKDMSMYALEEYTAVKHVVFELTGASRKDWYDAVSTPEES